MSFLSRTLYRSTEVLVFVAAAAIFIPLLSTNARFLDDNVFSCAFSGNGDVAACIWCCISSFVAAAFESLIDILKKATSLFTGGKLSNPVSGSGGSPSQCLRRQGDTSKLTTFLRSLLALAHRPLHHGVPEHPQPRRQSRENRHLSHRAAAPLCLPTAL